MWRKVTEDDLVSVLAQGEIDAYRRSSVSDPVVPQIRATVAYVRGVIRSSLSRVKMNADEETLPESLILPAMDYLRFSFCTRQNVPANESRTKAYENAINLFLDIREGKFIPESDTVETDTSGDVAGSPKSGAIHPHRLLD